MNINNAQMYTGGKLSYESRAIQPQVANGLIKKEKKINWMNSLWLIDSPV